MSGAKKWSRCRRVFKNLLLSRNACPISSFTSFFLLGIALLVGLSGFMALRPASSKTTAVEKKRDGSDVTQTRYVRSY